MVGPDAEATESWVLALLVNMHAGTLSDACSSSTGRMNGARKHAILPFRRDYCSHGRSNHLATEHGV